MFLIHGCAPRGIVRDRRQQVGRVLKPIRGGPKTVVASFERNGVSVKVVRQSRPIRVQVQVRHGGFGQYPELSIEKLGSGLYEVTGQPDAIGAALAALGEDLEWVKKVGHRAHGPNLQQSRPYHRR